MALSEKRCLYEVLGLSRDCSPDEIRSAYRRLALQRHPDKLVKSGVPEAEATGAFQELVNAYEVLSDPRERAWYDSHRSQILFSNLNPANSSYTSTSVPDLFSFFSNSVYSGYSDSGKGFYKVYGDLFDSIYHNELNFAKKLGLGLPKEAPVIGNLNSPYAQVSAFYNYWLGFVTVMDFCWVDQYDAMAGPNRKSRRLMEEENKKLRKKARKEYNETVRGLAEFVKKRDKRVIDMLVKKNEEKERKRGEERERRKEMDRQKAERARMYEEPEWEKVEDIDEEVVELMDDDEDKKGVPEELYCMACRKKFKSEKQWKNHAQSRKHKEKLVELRQAFADEDEEYKDQNIEDEEGGISEDVGGYFSADESMKDLQDKFEDSCGMQEMELMNETNEVKVDEKDMSTDIDSNTNEFSLELGSDDDEASLLEAMVSGRMTRNGADPMKKVQVVDDSDEMDFMEYNNLKGTRRNRGSRGRRTQRQEESMGDAAETTSAAEEKSAGKDDSTSIEQSSCQSLSANDANLKRDGLSDKSRNKPSRAAERREAAEKVNVSKLKAPSKGKKKGAKASSNSCSTCGEEFETRNKLHKHLGDTGHAALKSR